MFDLEQSIAEWRKQMLAAGIQTPVPLDELEIHLREEIELQIKSGLSKQRAFEAADQKLGQAGILKDEFKNKNKYIGQKFISNAFLISSVSSLFMLLAQFW